MQNLRAVHQTVNQIENLVAGYRTETWQGANQAAHMAFRQAVQVLCKHGWIPRDDAECLLQEQDSLCDCHQSSYIPASDTTAMNVAGKTLSEE